jgi:predicted dehydrogenase
MGFERTVRVGIVGSGFAGNFVRPAYEATENCEVADIVSPRDEAALARLLGREDLDLISVHSPPFLHLEHVRRAIAEGPPGRAILCDKPFGANGDEAAEIDRLARDAGIQTFVNFQLRILPARLALRDQVLSGAIGPIEHVRWTFEGPVWPPDRPYRWAHDASLGGGWLRASASHHIDFLRWTFGAITEASAALRITVPQRRDAEGVLREVTAEDGFTATMRTKTGTTMVIDASATAAVDLPQIITVIGRDGVLELRGETLSDVGGTVTRLTSEGATEIDLVPYGATEDPDVSAMLPWMPLICTALRGARDPVLPSFADGLAVHRVMDQLSPA